MKKIKLELSRKSIAEKLDMARVLSSQLTADADLQVQAAGNAISAQNTVLRTKDTDRTNKQNDALAATEALYREEDVWDNIMRAAASKVTEIYPDNIEKWKDIGFKISDEPGSSELPPKVENLSITLGDNSGEADLQWDNLYNVRIYKIAMTEGELTDASVWVPATPDMSSRSHITVTGLEAGKRVWFRVAGFNAAGQGSWSNPAGRIIS